MLFRSHGSSARLGLLFVVGLLTVLGVVITVTVFKVGSAQRESSIAAWAQSERAQFGLERVVNGRAENDTTGWSAGSSAGPVSVRRVALADGPQGARTAVDLQRAGDSGPWAFALGALQSPESVFQVGHLYDLQASVRDVSASGKSLGLLLANSNFANRPTAASQYGGYDDDAWHVMSLQFVATSRGAADTSLYLALPEFSPFHWQVTEASVREVESAVPPAVASPPTKVIGFDGPQGSAPDPHVWHHEIGGNGWGNNELQTYTGSTDNAYVDGKGRLVIAVRHEDKTGADGIDRKYTSARLTTQNSVEVRPGSYVEAPIRAQVGMGMWPAFWLIGTNNPKVGWPASGELDVVEAWGNAPTRALSTVHMPKAGAPSVDAKQAGIPTDLGAPLDKQTHTYGVYFDGEMVSFFVDHHPTMTLTAEEANASGAAWPFGSPQYLVLNVAVDGHQDPAKTSFPQTMTVGPIAIWTNGVPF